MATASSYDDHNIFARILRGEIPCHKVYEDEDTLVFMDVMPQSKGHALVIPKHPSRNLLDADAAILAPAMRIVQRVASAAMAAFAADGVMVIQYNEPSAGQTVFHLHFHVIPRYDGVQLHGHAREMEAPETLAAQAASLKAALRP